MIIRLPRLRSQRARRADRREWHRRFVPIRRVQLEGAPDRFVVVAQVLETRWSQTHRRRLWRLPETGR